MLNFGLFAFAQPWLLLALAALPVIWLLLRVTPPAPRLMRFPAIRLLFGLTPREETPAQTPPWLIILRLAIAALIILGLSEPVLNPATRLAGSGPLVLVIDDGWAAARHWPDRLATLDKLLDQAERDRRAVIVFTTAPSAAATKGAAPALSAALPATQARRLVQGLVPKPWPVDRSATVQAVANLNIEGMAHVVWLSNGLDDGAAITLAERLQRLGSLDVIRDGDSDLARVLRPPESDGVGFTIRMERPTTDSDDFATVLASADDGRIVARHPLTFTDGKREAEARLDLPAELRNRVARLSIDGEHTAAAVVLLDERWRRRPVGLVTTGPIDGKQPLLSETYYLQRALEPFTELRRGSIAELLNRKLAVLVLPDTGALVKKDHDRLAAWIEQGGLLLRFAGPRLAEGTGLSQVARSTDGQIGTNRQFNAPQLLTPQRSIPQPSTPSTAATAGSNAQPRSSEDPLLPVRLRGGNRILGGALTWSSPARLAPFDPASPFAGLPLSGDVLIERQVLAEPALDLGEKTWARLTDGTPLVTAARRGEGWIALVHTTANTDWSNLPLSGLFVDLLRRVIAVSQGVTGDSLAEQSLPPLETLNGFGQLGAPPTSALALDPTALKSGDIGPRNPPGYYGNDALRRAHNLSATLPLLSPITGLPSGVRTRLYAKSQEEELKPWLLAAAFMLALADLIISLALRGLLGPAVRRRALSVTLAVLVPTILFTGGALAQDSNQAKEARALEATILTRLAYVKTGVVTIDETSRAGLSGLTRVLQQRTSVEAGAPLGVDLARDELAFFPLLYWPVTPEQKNLGEFAEQSINNFLKNGGTILFDLREAGSGQILGRQSSGTQALQRLSQGINIPPLAPVPTDHVLTKSFYLMQEFPGRFSGNTVWIESTEAQINDGIAAVLVGSNDWAAAWAVNEFGQPLFPVVPGGERQREQAYRFGVNLVMYAMTGNYKADQVHVPFILERLGQ